MKTTLISAVLVLLFSGPLQARQAHFTVPKESLKKWYVAPIVRVVSNDVGIQTRSKNNFYRDFKYEMTRSDKFHMGNINEYDQFIQSDAEAYPELSDFVKFFELPDAARNADTFATIGGLGILRVRVTIVTEDEKSFTLIWDVETVANATVMNIVGKGPHVIGSSVTPKSSWVVHYTSMANAAREVAKHVDEQAIGDEKTRLLLWCVSSNSEDPICKQ